MPATCSWTSKGHPFWRADTGLFFLFGLLESGTVTEVGVPHVVSARLAAGRAPPRSSWSTTSFQRRQQFPNMHIYHYNHTELSALVRMAETHGLVESELTELITSAFIDLYGGSQRFFRSGRNRTD